MIGIRVVLGALLFRHVPENGPQFHVSDRIVRDKGSSGPAFWDTSAVWFLVLGTGNPLGPTERWEP